MSVHHFHHLFFQTHFYLSNLEHIIYSLTDLFFKQERKQHSGSCNFQNCEGKKKIFFSPDSKCLVIFNQFGFSTIFNAQLFYSKSQRISSLYFFFPQSRILIPRLGMEPAHLALLSVESEQLGLQGSPDSDCFLGGFCSSRADLGNCVYNRGISWCKER